MLFNSYNRYDSHLSGNTTNLNISVQEDIYKEKLFHRTKSKHQHSNSLLDIMLNKSEVSGGNVNTIINLVQTLASP
jgi:hypothetical protein